MTKEIMQKGIDNLIVKPNQIVFERLINLGNYENVKFGGIYQVPEGFTAKDCLSTVIEDITSQLDKYIETEIENNKDHSDYRKTEIKDAIIRTKKALENFVMGELKVSNFNLVGLYGQINEIQELIRTLTNHISIINTRLTTLFQMRDELATKLTPDEFKEYKEQNTYSYYEDAFEFVKKYTTWDL